MGGLSERRFQTRTVPSLEPVITALGEGYDTALTSSSWPARTAESLYDMLEGMFGSRLLWLILQSDPKCYNPGQEIIDLWKKLDL